ncbi:GSCOCG00001253001-RA-CDS, partial [Cotesia congregata]
MTNFIFFEDGNVGNYILRRLPHIQYLSTKYAYIRIKHVNQEKIWDNYVNNTNLSYDLQVPELKNVTINLLVVLDGFSVTKPRIELIRTLLMYFNYIDMFH